MASGDTLLSLVLEFLRETPGQASIVVDDSTRALVEAALARPDAPAAAILPVAHLAERARETPPEATWIAFSLADEAGLRAAIEAVRPAPIRPPVGVLRGLLVARLARLQRLQGAPRRPQPIPGLPAYAIACTPRSGSTYLGHLLASIGLGQPEEHLRDREVHALRDAAPLAPRDALEVLGEFMWRKQRNGWFGTKLISHFLFDLLDRARLPAEVCAAFRARVRIVYVLRRDKAAQAASDFLANHVKTWHVFDEAGRKALEASHGAVAYDYADMRRRFRFMREQEERLADWVRTMDHLLVDYDDLVADPEGTVRSVAAFLGAAAAGTPSAGVVSTRSDAADAIRARFAEDFGAQFGAPPPAFAPEGLRIARPAG